MKRFFYLSGSLFFLALTLLIGFHLGQKTARADWVYPGGHIVGLEDGVAVTEAGEAWNMNNNPPGWERSLMADLPVPPSQVKFWSVWQLVTTSDEGWVWSAEGWVNLGPISDGGVALEPTTWGQLKQRFGR